MLTIDDIAKVHYGRISIPKLALFVRKLWTLCGGPNSLSNVFQSQLHFRKTECPTKSIFLMQYDKNI